MAAATLAEINSLVNDPTLGNRVGVAMIKAAYNVSNEGALPDHTARLVLAKAILSNADGYKDRIRKFVVGGVVVANPTADLAALEAALTDANVQAYVDASFSVFSVA